MPTLAALLRRFRHLRGLRRLEHRLDAQAPDTARTSPTRRRRGF